MPNAQARPKAEQPARRESDDRGDRAVRTLRAEERLLEARVGALERLVAPVEAAASLSRLLQQREQHRSQQRAARARPSVGVRLREDRGSRLSFELRQCGLCVHERREPPGAGIQEGANERAILVERRPTAAVVLLEGERQIAALVQLAKRDGEGGEAERPERLVQMRCSDHPSAYAPG